MARDRKLLILACSATKRTDAVPLPAVERYDGPTYRVLRKFLRDAQWPTDLSVAVISAEHGLIGGLAGIHDYDRRMDRPRAAELAESSRKILASWSHLHDRMTVVAGQDYHPALGLGDLNQVSFSTSIIDGGIGVKQQQLRRFLQSVETRYREPRQPALQRALYFLPDWDDMLDANFNFERDAFSGPDKSSRREVHTVEAMRPCQICDGILISLAQRFGSKGALRRFQPTDRAALAPEPLRERFGLTDDQWLIGDCGAFSYVNEDEPTIAPEQAAALYQLHGFDLGASVDHIPMREIVTTSGKRVLSDDEREQRIQLTRDNAETFIQLHRKRKYSFHPIGVIQGIAAESYAKQLSDYVDMGYTHFGLGGLVPRSDTEIVSIVEAIKTARGELRRSDLWIHAFGIYRPKIHRRLHEMGITSFDSATYFRKAWLRSDQNYLGPDGNWYAAIRIPMTSDPRTRQRLKASGLTIEELERLEDTALRALHEYGREQRDLLSTLQAVAAYDFHLLRGKDHSHNLISAYRRTLKARPWTQCSCPVCRSIGIDVVIFRGYNRNKRRGAHNTLMLYGTVSTTTGENQSALETR